MASEIYLRGTRLYLSYVLISTVASTLLAGALYCLHAFVSQCTGGEVATYIYFGIASIIIISTTACFGKGRQLAVYGRLLGLFSIMVLAGNLRSESCRQSISTATRIAVDCLVCVSYLSAVMAQERKRSRSNEA